MPKHPALSACVVAVALLAGANARAANEWTVSFGTIDGQAWRARGLDVTVRFPPGDAAPSGSLSLAALELPGALPAIDNLRFACARLQLAAGKVDCLGGTLAREGTMTLLAKGDFHVDLGTKRLTFELPQVDLDGRRLAASGEVSPAAWRVAVDSRGTPVEALLELLGWHNELPGKLRPAGPVDLALRLTGAPGDGLAVSGELRSAGLELAGFEDRLAAEALAFRTEFELTQDKKDKDAWRFDITGGADGGQLYAEPVYLDLDKARVGYALAGRWDREELDIETLQFDQPGVVDAQGSLIYRLNEAPAVAAATLRITNGRLPGLYRNFVQPFVIGSMFDSLETEGRVDGEFGVADNQLMHLELDLDELYADDDKQRLSIDALDGAVTWRRGTAGDPQYEAARLSWQGGHVYRLRFGAAAVALDGVGDRLAFAQPLELPLVDGVLAINRFSFAQPGQAGQNIEFDAELLGVGMPALTRSLDWPPFAGTLGGRLPNVRYADNVLAVGGALEAAVFDGRVTVDQLRVENPFGVLPILTADVTARGLELEAVTSAFSFGRIEGRLDGDVRDLRMLNWVPVNFDARFYTPPGDRSRHRISQRAIENISDLGGFGTAAALSGGFLRFFEDFGYERIDIGCRLRNDICQMRGFDRSGDGYYIIKGKGLPRINVIGHAQSVSWPMLVDELNQVRRSEGPTLRTSE